MTKTLKTRALIVLAAIVGVITILGLDSGATVTDLRATFDAGTIDGGGYKGELPVGTFTIVDPPAGPPLSGKVAKCSLPVGSGTRYCRYIWDLQAAGAMPSAGDTPDALYARAQCS